MISYARLILLSFLLVASQAYGEKADVDIKPFLQFALGWTTHKYQNEALPEVEVIPHDWVQIYAHGDFEYGQAEYQGHALPVVNGYYDPRKKKIYLSDRLDLNDPKTGITLVHEIVHYLQDITGYTASVGEYLECTENEAYEVQILWQREFHVDEASIDDAYRNSLIASMKCMGSKSRAFPRYTD